MSEITPLWGNIALPPAVTGILTVAGLVFLASYVFRPVNNVMRMMMLWGRGVAFLLFNSDQRYKIPHQDPEIILLPTYNGPIEEVTVTFIRHGESSWNEVFNRGFGPSFLVRLFNAVVVESIYAFLGDSVFLDSPLSPLGYQQAIALQDFVKNAPPDAQVDAHGETLSPTQRRIYQSTVAALRGHGLAGGAPPVMSVSNLRRAIATIAVGLAPTLGGVNSPVVHCLSSLQEVARNVDTQSLLPPRHRPALMLASPARAGTRPHLLPPPPGGSSVLTSDTLAGADAALSAFVWSGNTGNKPFFGKALQRLRRFATFACQSAAPTAEAAPVVIGVGHSLWFKEFFKVHLPRTNQHVSKRKKMMNASVVSFVLRKGRLGNEDVFAIVPDSITCVFLGFAQ